MRAPRWLTGILQRGPARPDIELTPRNGSSPTVQRWGSEPGHVRIEFEDQGTRQYVSVRLHRHDAQAVGLSLLRHASVIEKELAAMTARYNEANGDYP